MGRCNGISGVTVAIRHANQNDDDDEANDGATHRDDGHRNGSNDDDHRSESNDGIHCDDCLNVQIDAMNCDVIAKPNPILLDLIR